MSATRVVLPRLAEFGGDPDTGPSSQHHLQRLHPGSSSVTPTLIKRVTRCQITRPPKMVSECITSLTKTNSMLDLALSGIPHEKSLHLPKIEEDALKQTDTGQLAPSPLPHLIRSKHRITTSSLFPEPPPLLTPAPAKSGSRLNLDLAIEGQDMRLPPRRTPTESRKTDVTKKPRLLTTPLKIRSSSDDLPKGVISFEENIRKLLHCQSLGVPIESKYQASGNIATPVFHCPRCLKHWAMYNVTPHGCKQTAKPTKGPSFYITNTGNQILKTFQAMPKDHQHKFLDKISSIVPDAKGIIHVPNVEYLTIAMGKRSSDTLHGKRAELVAKKSDQAVVVSPSVSVINGWDTTESDSKIVTPSRVSNRIVEPEPAFLRIHERPVVSALVNATTGVKRGKSSEINQVVYDDRPSTSIGQTSHISDQAVLGINDERNTSKTQLVSYESCNDTTTVTSRVTAHRSEITETTGQFAPDGTYYTGIYAHDGQFIPNGRISPNSRRQSGLLGPDGRFYVYAYYDQHGKFYGRESKAYVIGFTFLNAAQVPTQNNNLKNNDYVIIEKPQSHSHIGQSFEMSDQSADLDHPAGVVRSCRSAQTEKIGDCRVLIKRREQPDKTNSKENSKENNRTGHANSESSAEINPEFQNTGLVTAESNTMLNGFNTPERTSHNQMKNDDDVERITNSMGKENNTLPLPKEMKSEKQHDHLRNDFIQETTIADEMIIKEDNISIFGGKERYTYSDESFDSLFEDASIADDDSEVGVVKNRQEEQGSIAIANETEHLSKGKTDNGLNPKPKQRRESTLNYMGVKDKTTVTDSHESLSNSRNKAKESKKRVIKNKAVKNVTGKPDTKPGSLQKHMFATPEESLAKASAVLGATSKRKSTKLNQLVNSSNTMVTGKIPTLPASRDDFPANVTNSGSIRSVTKLPSRSDSFKEPSKKYSLFKSESGVGINDDVLNERPVSSAGETKRGTERTISSAGETKRGTLPVLPGISTNHSVNEDEIPRRKPREIIKKVAKNKRKTVGEIKTKSKTTENQSNETDELKLFDLDSEQTEIKPQLTNQPLERTQSSDINIMFQSDLVPKLLQDNTNTTSHRMTYSTLPSTFGKFPKPLATPSSQKISSTGDFAIQTDATKYELADVVSNSEGHKQPAAEVLLESPTQKVKGCASATSTSSYTSLATSSQESIFESVSQIWRRHGDELIRLQELENNGGLSILNFTPAFRFSFFDIPYEYAEHNNKLIERASKLRHLKQPKKSKRKVVKKPKPLKETEALKI